jgi:hypothetical protein
MALLGIGEDSPNHRSFELTSPKLRARVRRQHEAWDRGSLAFQQANAAPIAPVHVPCRIAMVQATIGRAPNRMRALAYLRR